MAAILVGAVLRDRVGDDMRASMTARDALRTSTLRMLIAAMDYRRIELGHALEDDEVHEVIAKEAKRRRESIDAFGDAGRQDLVDKETAELAVLQSYLPAGLGDEELAALVDEAIAETGATGPREMGAVMKALMPKVKGRADGGAVSALVKAKLGA
jgi:hypothetical protein